MISPWSIRSHAVCVAKAAVRANTMATALCADDPLEHGYCAAQLLAAATELAVEAETILRKVKAGEGSCLEATLQEALQPTIEDADNV